MGRIKTWFGLAAAAVIAAAGALTLPDALDQESGSLAPAVDCQEWREWRIRADNRAQVQWMVVRQDVWSSLAATDTFYHSTAGARILGTVGSNPRSRIIANAGCPRAYRYDFNFGPNFRVGGQNWRAVRIRAGRMLLRSWQLFADESPGVVWLGGYNDGLANCAASSLTEAQCRGIIATHPLGGCWNQSGTLCRKGATPQGVACDHTTGTWVPCRVSLGEDADAVAVAPNPDLSAE